MQIKENGRGCPRGALPKTTKTIKQKQAKPPKPQKTTKSDGNQRKWYGVLQVGPTKNYKKTPKPSTQAKTTKTTKTIKKPTNLMEIKRNGKGYPREAVGDLMGLKGDWEGVP